MEGSSVETNAARQNRPRNAFVAFLFSFFLPGLGQIYNEQYRKGGVFFGITILLQLIFNITRWIATFEGLVILVVVELGFRIYIIIDAIRNVKRPLENSLARAHHWKYLLVVGVIMVGISLIPKQTMLGIETFKITSPTLEPTIQIGDKIVADLQAYRNSEPQYGDLVVFTHSDGQSYLFRVIALPGDSFELVDNSPRINGKLCESSFIRELMLDNIPAKEFLETLPNGYQHAVYKFSLPFTVPSSKVEAILIPEGHYFLLGDNRDNAADSRILGLVERENVTGKVVFSYWGKTMDRVNIAF